MKFKNLLNKKTIIVMGIIILGLITVLIYQSYALFKTSKQMNFINAKVGEFGPNGDLTVAVYIDGEKSNDFPSKTSGKMYEKIVCTNGGDGIWNDNSWELSVVGVTEPTVCNVYFVTDDGSIAKYSTNFGSVYTDAFYSGTATSDGGFIAVGTTDIPSKNGDFLTNHKGTLRGSNDALIVKYDANGNIVWSNSFGSTANDYFNSIAIASDGGFIAVGYTSAINKDSDFLLSSYKGTLRGSSDGLIVKYDVDGNIVWSNSFGSSTNDYFYSISSTPDGGFIVVGNTAATSKNGDFSLASYKGTLRGAGDGLLVKYDANGNIIWSNSFGSTATDYFQSVTLTSDGEFIVVGATTATSKDGDFLINHKGTLRGGIDGLIVKYNTDGDLVWSNSFGSGSDESFNSITTTDGGVVAAGRTTTTGLSGDFLTNHKEILNGGSNDALIVKYNTDGDLVWSNSFGSAQSDQFASITTTSDAGIIAVGTTTAQSRTGHFMLPNYKGTSLFYESSAIIVRFNSSGNLIWSSSFGGNAGESFSSISPTLDGGYITVGTTRATSAYGDLLTNHKGTLRGGNDGLIVKYDSRGNFN